MLYLAEDVVCQQEGVLQGSGLPNHTQQPAGQYAMSEAAFDYLMGRDRFIGQHKAQTCGYT